MRRMGGEQVEGCEAWRQRGWAVLVLALVAVGLPAVAGVPARPAAAVATSAAISAPPPEGSYYRPIAPVRSNPVDLGPGGTTNVQVTGVGGVPTDGVRAVLVNLTGSRATQSTTINVTATGAPAPATANLTLPPLLTADNLAIVPVGPGGLVTVRNALGRVTVGLDVLGWFPVQSDLVMVAPSRLADTRNGSAPDTPVRSGSPLDIAVTGGAGVPSTGVGMAIVNVTALDATTLTSLSVGAKGSAPAAIPNVNVVPLLPATNLAIVPIGSNGAISIANRSGRVNVIVDILGWLPPTTDAHLVAPGALLDTRLGDSTSVDVQVAGRAGVPSAGVAAVILSVSGSRATKATALTVHPTNVVRPAASSVQVPPLLPAENLVVVPLTPDGKVRIQNATGSVNVTVDVRGWFAQEPAPIDGSWVFEPDTLMMTASGQSADVMLVHLGVDGLPTGAAPPSGIVLTPRADASSFGVVELARGRYRLTAATQVGSVEFDASVPGIDTPATLRATNLRLRDGVAVIGSDRIVVPAPDGGTAISGPFSESEVHSRAVAPAPDGDPFDDDIRLPVVLRGDAPATGTLVISADGLAFAGRVVEPAGLPTLVRDGHSLISLAITSPFEIFSDVSSSSSGQAPTGGTPALASTGNVGRARGPRAAMPARSLLAPALASPSCETESASKAVELKAGLTQFKPQPTFDAGGNPEVGNAFVDVGLEGDITVGFELTLQLAQDVTLDCTLLKSPTVEIVPLGLGAVLTAFADFGLHFHAEIKGTVGPRVTIGFSCTQHIGYEEHVTYDTQLGLQHRERNTTTPATCEPSFEAVADPAAVTIEANAGLFANADFGVRVGGAFAAWADRAGFAEGLGQVKLLNFKAGPRLHGIWENEAKVLASENTAATLGVEILVEGAIDLEVGGQSAGAGVFDRLAQWISGDPTAQAEIKFLEFHFPALTLYRPPAPRPGGLEIRVNGALQAADQAVEVKPGDRVEVRAGLDRKGDTVPFRGDAAVAGGTAYRQTGLTTVPFDALALTALDQGGGAAQLLGTLDVLPSLCDQFGGAAQTIQLLANAPMLGVLPTSGFAGKFSIVCAGPRLEFDRASVDFLANEVGYPATVGLTGFDIKDWDWSLTGVQSWLNATPAAGVFDSDQEREPIVLTIDCSAVNPPAVVSHTLVATASTPGQESKQALLPVSADCRNQSEIDVPGQVVLDTWQPGGLPNDPNRCITVQFLQFPALQGATSYTAVVLNQILGVNQTFTAAPPWPADSYTVSVGPTITHTFVAPGSSHRMVLGSESSGQGCNSSPRFTLVSLKARIG